jgi:integrase
LGAFGAFERSRVDRLWINVGDFWGGRGMGKAAKGSVSVQAIRGRLRLRWRVDGEPYTLSLGYPDQPKYQSVAILKAKQIEQDILFDRFDPTLNKYNGKARLEEVEEPKVSLIDLWDGYTDFKRTQLKPSSIATTYRQVRRVLTQLPTTDPSEAIAIRDWALAHKTTDAAKRFVEQCTACCNWAIESGLLETNSFLGLARRIKVVKSQEDEETDINPFTAAERGRIIEAFERNRYFNYYGPLVKFLFATGCRPSEALALQWKHISKDFLNIRLEQGLTPTEEGLGIVEGLKTQRRRNFPCHEQLQELLREMRSIAAANSKGKDIQEQLIFPAPKGGFIIWANFERRGWTKILQQCDFEFRRPYQMRHTFITLALAVPTPPQDVAKLAGTSTKMIFEHYAGVSRDLRLPADF